MSAEMRLETITPEKASEWLKHNKSNRALSSGHVARLAAAITAGEWKLNGESIKFNGTQLVDGQHRLNAIIRAGIPVKSYVVRGLESDVFDTLDQGKVRSLGDILSVTGEKNCVTLASATRWFWVLKNKTTVGACSSITNATMCEFLQKHPGLRESVDFVRKTDMQNISISRGILSAFHFAFSEKDKEAADRFIVRVLAGEGIDRAMPEYKLRSAILDQSKSAKKLHVNQMATLIAKTWNACRSGKPLKQLKVSQDETRPELI